MSKARAPKHPPPSPSEPSVEAPAEGFTTDPHGRTIAHVPKPSPPSNHLACHLLPMLRARHKVIGGVLPMSTAASLKVPLISSFHPTAKANRNSLLARDRSVQFDSSFHVATKDQTMTMTLKGELPLLRIPMT